MEIYSNYDDEPEPIFTPLTEKLFCEFYDMEMERFEDDIDFYNRYLPEKCSILELGCGTGRIARRVAGKDRRVTGIDISPHMLKKANRKKSNYCRYICMNMEQLAFTSFFDAILIPYNTLNLLSKKKRIVSCLKDCRSHLTESGKLYLQLFIPDKKLTSHKGKIFQFQIFNRRNQTNEEKIIKEILKNYSAETETLSIEERYRIRPTQPRSGNQDWNHFYSIAALSYSQWISLFKQADLHIIKACGDYDLNPFHEGNSSCLFAVLARRRD